MNKEIIVICALAAIAIYMFVKTVFQVKKAAISARDRMSFKETLDLTGLPIVTFKIGEEKFNFLLDTGATNSVINKAVADVVPHVKFKETSKFYGVDGNTSEMEIVGIGLEYKGRLYVDQFTVSDLTKALDNIRDDYKVTLHGMIGSRFFQKYKYIIDFDSLIAYPTK